MRDKCYTLSLNIFLTLQHPSAIDVDKELYKLMF